MKKIFISLGIISIMFVTVWAAFGFPRGEYFWLLSIASLSLVLEYQKKCQSKKP